jgi:ketosteroid isomerase-like protein
MHKPKLWVGTLVALLLLAWSFGAQALAADAKAQITELEHKCVTPLVAGPLDEAMECFDTTDTDLVVYDIFTPREYDGPAAVRSFFKNYFDNGGYKDVKMDFVYLRVVADGKLGIAYSTQHFTAIDKNGKPIEGFPRVVDVWRLRNGSWKMILQMASVPVDPVTYKADLLSKP